MELDADSLITKEERESLLGDSHDEEDVDEDEEDEEDEGVLRHVRILIPEISVDDFNELTKALDDLGIDYEEL